MLKTTIQAMRAGGADTPKIMTGRFSDLRALTVPVTELVGKKPSPTYKHVVEEIRPIRDLVQRDMSGAKATNAKTRLPAYVGRKLTPEGEWTGPGWNFIIWLPDRLESAGDDDGVTNYQHDQTNLGFFLDGESRGLCLEDMILKEDDPDRRKALMNIPVIVQIYDGIPVERAAQHFRDTNGLGVGINSALLVGHDYEDQWMETTRKVFAELGIPLEDQSRQVKANSPAVLTVVAARAMVAAIARGISAVQFGAGTIPLKLDKEAVVDFTKLQSAATTWLGHVFSTLGVTAFKDKNLVLRAVPVSTALGALGRPFYTGDLDGQLSAKAVLNSDIDWLAGPHWSGVAGKVNPNGAFSVGSGKENGYATYRALTERSDPGYNSVRHLRAAE